MKISMRNKQEDIVYGEIVDTENLKPYDKFVDLLNALPEEKRYKYIQMLIDEIEGNKPN